MPEAAAQSRQSPNALSTAHARTFISIALLAMLFALSTWATLNSVPGTWLESLTFAALLFIAAAMTVAGRPFHLAQSAAGRIALAGLAAAEMMSVYPPFHWMAAGTGGTAPSTTLQIVPIFILTLLWMLQNRSAMFANPLNSGPLEMFLHAPKPRAYLFLLAALGTLGMSAASGWGIRAALFPALFAGVLMWSSSALIRLAATPAGAWALALCALVSSGLAANSGLHAYFNLRDEAARAIASVKDGHADDARREYDHVLQLSQTLRTDGPREEMETALARHYEQKSDLQNALKHWENVARLQGLAAPFDTFAPVQRVKCSMGDSLPAWRRLVFEGFKTIADPEIAPGIMKMGETAPDVRAKLLAALLAWNNDAPEAERRKWLDAVQAVSPGEPSSLNLLKRLGGPVKDVPMSLSPELLVGKIPYQSVEKTLEESGEAGTVVCLNPGHWELCLRAAGTPLHEEWPIVRVELNGTVLATTQVNKAVEYDVPFTFDVTRNDIYKLKIVFQNHEEDLEEGRAARRGLRIAGIKFNHSGQ